MMVFMVFHYRRRQFDSEKIITAIKEFCPTTAGVRNDICAEYLPCIRMPGDLMWLSGTPGSHLDGLNRE